MNLSFKENYWDMPQLKATFIRFLKQIHGLDLSLWDEKGFWDDNYRPFSYFSDDSIVSSVCVYSMNMTIQGEQRLVAQISAVGTVPEYRRKGLNLDLTQKAMEWAQSNHDFFYLFADKEAHAFYKRCGFRTVDEYKARISVSGKDAQSGAVKLHVQDKEQLETIYRFALGREPVSDILGVSNEKLFMFWCLYFLSDHIYHIPELDILVLFKRDKGTVTIFDIIGQHIPPFSEIYPFIGQRSDKTVEFLFMVDKLNLHSYDLIKIKDNKAHLSGSFPLESTQFIFPCTAQA